MKGNIYTHSIPRKWSKEEEQKLLDLKEKGYSNLEIAEMLDRTEISIQVKHKRIKKKDGSYNEKHILEKYELNDKFVKMIEPKTILDVFAGKESFYSKYDVDLISNDIKEYYKTDYHLDYLKLLCKMYYKGKRFDLIDLDPFGSAFDGFDLAIKMANKGLVITLGELGHQRWKRLDFVENRYFIDDLNDFTLNRLVSEIQKIGLRNKKQLEVVYLTEWRNIGRVWFKIEPVKITSQWEKKEKVTLFDFLD